MTPSSEPPLSMPRDLFYGGRWHAPLGGYAETIDPATGRSLGQAANANAADVAAAVAAARSAFPAWRAVKPLERARLLREVADRIRRNAPAIALADALNGGNPIAEMQSDARVAAAQFDFFAGLVTELKGDTIPMGDEVLNYTRREPYGVVGRIVAYNHPFMFTAGKSAAPLAAGNTVVMKPPHQAPLSALLFAQLVADALPPGVLNIVSGGAECGQALVAHPDVPRVSLIGSVPTGRAIARAAAERLKHVTLELGGKNACIVYPDADLGRAVEAAVKGMNFTWCGQSCGSTSRLFLHESIHDRVLKEIVGRAAHFKPGIPTDPRTTMGAIISRAQLDKILGYIRIAAEQGARLVYGGNRPSDPALADGFFVEPTIFADVTQDMRIAREEVFGPVLAVLKWRDEDEMLRQVNSVEYGLTAAIFTRDLATAHRAAARVEAGYVWVNSVGAHFLGAGFGGVKQSGMGREESVEELVSFTQPKNIHVTL